MEYKRKKVEKIKLEKPDKKIKPQNAPVRRPAASRPMPKPEPMGDVGFDVDDIPMSPKSSSEIHRENIDAAPKERDVRLGLGKKPAQNNRHGSHNEQDASKISKNEEKTEKNIFKLISGGKLERLKERKKTLTVALVAFAAVLTLLIVALVTPASLLEIMQNNITAWGRGDGLPVQVSGASIVDMQTRNGTVFVMTDTRVSAYNSTGRQIQVINHGYSNPELYVSDTRTLVYDRGGTKIRVDTLNTNIADKTLSKKIITAALADNGRVGIITEGEKTPSQLVVTDKSFSKFAAWTSSDRLAAVAMSRNGKYAAVSAVVSESGTFKSTVYLLDISGDSIKQVNQLDFSGVPIVTLETVGNRCVAVGTDTVVSFDFEGGNRIEKKIDYLKTVRFESKQRVLITHNPSNNVQQTQIILTDKSLTEELNITVNGIVDKVSVADDGIAVISNHTLIMYDKNGKEVSRTDVGYEGIFISSYLDGTAVLSDMKLNYYEYGVKG